MAEIADRPMWPPGAEIAAQAFQAFELWCEAHAEELQDLDILEKVERYPVHIHHRGNENHD